MNRYRTSNVGQDTRLLRADELDVVNGGFIVDGCIVTLGGPDTSPVKYFGDPGGLSNPNERTS